MERVTVVWVARVSHGALDQRKARAFQSHVARWMARRLAASLFDVEADSVEVTRRPHGAPAFVGLDGALSMSHSQALVAVAAASAAGALGVDVELESKGAGIALRRHVAAPIEDLSLATRMWCRSEARYKSGVPHRPRYSLDRSFTIDGESYALAVASPFPLRMWRGEVGSLAAC